MQIHAGRLLTVLLEYGITGKEAVDALAAFAFVDVSKMDLVSHLKCVIQSFIGCSAGACTVQQIDIIPKCLNVLD